jgi:hypothetical protein
VTLDRDGACHFVAVGRYWNTMEEEKFEMIKMMGQGGKTDEERKRKLRRKNV